MPATEIGHETGRFYVDHDGHPHLNGASFYNSSGDDVKPGIENAGMLNVTPGTVTENKALVAGTGGALNLGGKQAATHAAGATASGLLVVHRIAVADANGDTDVVVDDKLMVLDVIVQNRGIAAHATDDTVVVKNGANAITNTIAKTATVEGVVRSASINPANSTIAAGGTLRVTAAKSTNVACEVDVICCRVA